MALRSRLLPLCLAALCVNLMFKATAFTGITSIPKARMQTQRAALPLEQGDVMSAMTDASTMILADDVESIPAVAFAVSIFVASGFGLRTGGHRGLLDVDSLRPRCFRPPRPLRGARGLGLPGTWNLHLRELWKALCKIDTTQCTFSRVTANNLNC
eukprot:g22607.t1